MNYPVAPSFFKAPRLVSRRLAKDPLLDSNIGYGIISIADRTNGALGWCRSNAEGGSTAASANGSPGVPQRGDQRLARRLVVQRACQHGPALVCSDLENFRSRHRVFRGFHGARNRELRQRRVPQARGLCQQRPRGRRDADFQPFGLRCAVVFGGHPGTLRWRRQLGGACPIIIREISRSSPGKRGARGAIA